MNKITLTHEEWYKVFIILDSLDHTKVYDKHFLLFAEYYKSKLFNTAKIYIAAVESLTPEPNTEISKFFIERQLLQKTEFKSTEESTMAITNLEQKYKASLIEYSVSNDEVKNIMFSSVSFELYKIPSNLIPDLGEDRVELLKYVTAEVG